MCLIKLASWTVSLSISTSESESESFDASCLVTTAARKRDIPIYTGRTDGRLFWEKTDQIEGLKGTT